jgi:hypothetical protein
VARNYPPPFFFKNFLLTYLFPIKISLLIHLIFLNLIFRCPYLYNLILTAIYWCQPNKGCSCIYAYLMKKTMLTFCYKIFYFALNQRFYFLWQINCITLVTEFSALKQPPPLSNPFLKLDPRLCNPFSTSLYIYKVQ